MKHSFFILMSGIWILTSGFSPAILDTNNNGASDLWEIIHNNGDLFTTFDPNADPDNDGWTNAQEATAGTDPFDANAPAGFLRPVITHIPAVYLPPEEEGGPPVLSTPEAVTITWPTLVGKQYTLLFSSDLTAGSWLSLGYPRIGDGTEIGNGIPLTQPDGSTPPRIFWRVAVNDIDIDGDNLTDAEEHDLGTDPNKNDTDGDGVSDSDEIIVNFTNPLTATDADGDGIPDDFEKHLARLLLAYQPDAAYWGGYHAGLLTGNLDATHDYTAEGISALELAEILKKIPAAGSAASGYVVERQERRNLIPWAYYFPPGAPISSVGIYYHSVPNEFDVGEQIAPTADFGSQYLLSRIEEVTWGGGSMTPGDHMGFSNEMVASGFISTPELIWGGTKYQGFINQQRFRVIATSAGHEAHFKSYLKVTMEGHHYSWELQGVLAVEPLTIQLPKGKFVSEWFEFKAPMVDEKSTEMVLLPVDLDVAKITHNAASGELDDSKKESTGAFLPLNSDDDDYSATLTNLGSDKDQSGALNGENDLLPVYLRKIPHLTGAKFLLGIPSTIKIWKNPNRQDQVFATTELDATVDTTVYAEGVSNGSALLKLTLRHDGQDKSNIARIKITVFELRGVLNVPGYSAYNYTADGALPIGSKWQTPTNGTLNSGSTSTQGTILWDQGPSVGKAVYEVSSDYVWNLEVNVVQIKLATGTSNKIVYGGDLGQKGKFIRSSTTGKAMEARLTLDKVIGPSVSGTTRGEKFLDIGFIQNGQVTRKYALYNGFTPTKSRRSSVQNGISYIDCYTLAPASTAPWYDSANATGSDGFHRVPAGGLTGHVLNVSDIPEISATDGMTLTIGTVSDMADKFAIEMDFNLYLAVRTIQDVNASQRVFTQRGKASWEFDGSGDINGSGVWTETGSGNTGSASFAEITNGEVVPVTTGTALNALFGTQTWTTENQ